jgi:hypothetical protein
VSVADEQPGHLQKRGGSQAKGVIAWIPSRPQPGCRLGRQALQPALVCESDGIGVDLLHQARQTALATIVIFDGRRHAAHGFDDRAPARRRDHSRDAALRLSRGVSGRRSSSDLARLEVGALSTSFTRWTRAG